MIHYLVLVNSFNYQMSSHSRYGDKASAVEDREKSRNAGRNGTSTLIQYSICCNSTFKSDFEHLLSCAEHSHINLNKHMNAHFNGFPHATHLIM